MYKLYTHIWWILESIKADCKLQQTWIEWVTKYTAYKKYKPIDIYAVMEKYPINVFPNLYKISLAKEAAEIITETDLLDSDLIEVITFIKNNNEEEANIWDEQQWT